MKIKKISLLICVVILIELFSIGVSAATQEHDISKDDVILNDSCGDNCSGHVITGDNNGNNIQILSGDHKVTLKDMTVHCSYPANMKDERIPDGSALYIADGVKHVELTIEGEVYLHCVYGLYSAANELVILGNDTSNLIVSGRYEGAYIKNDLVIKGGNTYFGTGAHTGEGSYKPHLRGLAIDGTVTFEDAEIEAATSSFPVTSNMSQIYVGGANGDVASAAIKANELIMKNSQLFARCDSVGYKEGTFPKSIAIDAVEMSVTNSEINATGGKSYNSYGIRCTGNANFTNSEVTAKSGVAQNESIGFNAIGATAVGLNDNASFSLSGGKSDYISVGGYFNMMDVADSTVYAYGGEAKRHSAGMVGGMLSVDGSDVKGYGGVATDTNVIETEYGKEGVFSEGLSFVTIRSTDSEICGEGEKAMISTGVAATEISIDGGVIYGSGYDEGDDSFGIYLEPSEMDDGTPIPVKFELCGGDVVAYGGTQGILADTEDFAGISYKVDENAKTQVKTDLDSKVCLFGNKYKVSYVGGDVDAENLPADDACYRDELYTLPKEGPTAEGYLFVGWKDDNGMFFKAEDDNNVFMNGEDVVYTAVWKCAGGKNCILHKFGDLNAKAWYHDGIEYCFERKIMQGMSKTTYEPDTAATRAMIVTTLYRMEGEPKVEPQSELSDVPADAWYADAVNWAVECNIVKGYEDGSFRPNQPATREELAAFIFRMAKYFGLDVTAPELPDRFADKDAVSKWAVPALSWAVDQSIINGLGKEALVPQGNASRAQLATMLYRFELSLAVEA